MDSSDKTTPFYSSKEYPELALLEQNWSVIEREIPPFERSGVKIQRNPDAFANEEGQEFVDSLTSCEWMVGGKYVDRWYNFPIMRCNQFILDIQNIMPKTCEIIQKMQD